MAERVSAISSSRITGPFSRLLYRRRCDDRGAGDGRLLRFMRPRLRQLFGSLSGMAMLPRIIAAAIQETVELLSWPRPTRRCDKKSVANRAQRMSRWLSPGLFSSLAHPFQQFGRSGDAGIEWHALWAVENHLVIAALHSIEDPLS